MIQPCEIKQEMPAIDTAILTNTFAESELNVKCETEDPSHTNSTGYGTELGHLNLPVNGVHLTCRFCYMRFTHEHGLYEHLRCYHLNFNSHVLNEQVIIAEQQMGRQRFFQPSYLCDVCNLHFTCQEHLDNHLLLHSNEYGRRHIMNDNSSGGSFYGNTTVTLNASQQNVEPPKTASLANGRERKNGCPSCDEYFRLKRDLEQHLVVRHNIKPVKCDTCSKCFSRLDTLEKHKRVHKRTINESQQNVERLKNTSLTTLTNCKEKKNKCPSCGECFQLKRNLEQHLLVSHNIKPYKCITCDKGFSRQYALDCHKKRVHESTRTQFECEVCGKLYSTKTNYVNHLTTHNITLSSEALLCGVDGMTDMKNSHSTAYNGTKFVLKPYKCSKCGRGFQTNSSLRLHLSVHTDEKPFKCDICSKCFRLRALLTYHKKVHMYDNPFVCDVCANSFENKGKLDDHKRIHTGESPFQCDSCQRVFKSNSGLRGHQATDHPHQVEKLLQCNVCGRGFVNKSQLNQHIASHTDVRPHKCETCGKTFHSESRLKFHAKAHSKDFLCDVCGKGFGWMDGFLGHYRTHTGEKPFKCEICSKRFAVNQALLSHKRTHTGEKPHTCKVCGKGLSCKRSLRKHEATHKTTDIE